MRKRPFYQIYFRLLFVLLFVFQQAGIHAQQLSKNFTVEDGLPSNLIYSMISDDKGFLWVGTDNGVVRFDGKYFRLFTTDDGLPDNEILEVRKENDGTIWVNTFKQGPFYFDEKSNRFIDPLKGININKDFIKMVLHVRILEEGGIVFYNGDDELVFKSRKFVQLPYKTAFSYPVGKERAFLSSSIKSENGISNYVYFNKGNRRDSTRLYITNPDDVYSVQFLHDKKLYVLTRKGDFYVVGYDEAHSKFVINKIHIEDELSFFRVTNKRINIISTTGKIYVYNLNGFFEHYVIAEKDFSNCIFEDAQKNIWVGTLNKGLRLYKLNQIERILSKPGQEEDFLSIHAAQNGKIYTGNYFGEISEINVNGTQKVYQPFNSKKQIWIRTILSAQNKVFAISEQGVIVDFKRLVYGNNGELLQRMKDAAVLNDSIIIVGGVDPRGGLFKLNVRTEKSSPLNCNLMRVSKVKGLFGRFVYCATNDGLYKYDYKANALVNDFANTPLRTERILEIETTKEGLVIVATTTKGVFILKDDKIIGRLDNELIINNNITDINATMPNVIWMTSRKGLSKIGYNFNGNAFTYNVQNFSMTEGLPGNVLTDVSYRNDSLFLATEKGVAFVPANVELEASPIKTFLTNIKVNHQSIPLNPQNLYELDYEQRSVWLEFSGVDLRGHLKRLQYSFDVKKGWINLDADGLSLELANGEHTLHVRAVDVNGGKTHPITTIYFNVRSPFYVRSWFIMLVAGIIAGLIVFVVARVRSVKQKRQFQNQLKIEQERNRIIADLHDDIGSTLSSLQIYGDIAYNVIDKDKEKAKAMLAHITSGASKISENIGDIIWSMRGNQAYALSLESRLKNIVSETLGPTDIDYEIHIDETADKKITYITSRKNMILIVKEALNNIAKYSKALKVSVRLNRTGNNYTLIIKDNGIGMNLNETLNVGNGLFNMKKRMEEVNGKCDIVSAPGQGTEIICVFPVTKN